MSACGVGISAAMRSAKYEGARSWGHLKTQVKILKEIRCVTWNQYSSAIRPAEGRSVNTQRQVMQPCSESMYIAKQTLPMLKNSFLPVTLSRVLVLCTLHCQKHQDTEVMYGTYKIVNMQDRLQREFWCYVSGTAAA